MQVLNQVLRAGLHNILEAQVVGERVDVRQQVAGHFKFGRVNVVDADLQSLVV